MSKADKRENIIMVMPGETRNYGLTTNIRLRVSPSRSSEVSYVLSDSHLTADSFIADWMEIKTNHMVVITPKMNLLLIPIIDKYYVPPSDPAALERTTEFAQEKGLLNPR